MLKSKSNHSNLYLISLTCCGKCLFKLIHFQNCPAESILAPVSPYSVSSPNPESTPSPHFWMLVAGGVGAPLICLIHITIVFIGEAVLDRGYEPVTPL